MLSYLHGFHAGNFADVQKHSAQMLVLRMMQAKPSAIAMFDTHAGSARYNLNDERALKTGEADKGVLAVWRIRDQLVTDDWTAWFALLAEYGQGEALTSYPGSPEWFRQHLRDKDSLCAWELHPAEGESLSLWAEGDGRIKAIRGDGLAGLARQLPPKQPRLMVLMDPSYEVKTDYESVADALIKAWKACRHGVLLVWYPILAGEPHQKLVSAIVDSPVRKVLRQEVRLQSPPERGMSGSGLLVVNPPWGFEERLNRMMAEAGIPEALNLSVASDWLVPE